jgi:hypothetical protein
MNDPTLLYHAEPQDPTSDERCACSRTEEEAIPRLLSQKVLGQDDTRGMCREEVGRHSRNWLETLANATRLMLY